MGGLHHQPKKIFEKQCLGKGPYVELHSRRNSPLRRLWLLHFVIWGGEAAGGGGGGPIIFIPGVASLHRGHAVGRSWMTHSVRFPGLSTNSTNTRTHGRASTHRCPLPHTPDCVPILLCRRCHNVTAAGICCTSSVVHSNTQKHNGRGLY